MEIHRRRHLPTHLGPATSHVFLTVCTKDRQRILTTADAVNVVTEAWKANDDWLVGRYVFMPDHIHLFCQERPESRPLETWIRAWKRTATDNWPTERNGPIWQVGAFSHWLRKDESAMAKWEYVIQNPVRAGLVERPDEWPFQGDLGGCNL